MNTSIRPQLIDDLRDRIRGIVGSSHPRVAEAAVVSTGCSALDRLLADGGLKWGTLTEWRGDGEGSGAASVALVVAAYVLREGGTFVVIDGGAEFYPVAAARLGIPLDRTVVVRPDAPAAVLWAWEQSLRCPGVAVTFGCVDRIDERVFRRLQLGAETGGGLGFLLRPPNCRLGPSWAATRICVTSKSHPEPLHMLGRRLHLRLSGGLCGTREAALEVELTHEASRVHLVPQLARPAEVCRSAIGSVPGGGFVLARQSRQNAGGRLLPRRPPSRSDAGDAAC
jgi:hypothetical protein